MKQVFKIFGVCTILIGLIGGVQVFAATSKPGSSLPTQSGGHKFKCFTKMSGRFLNPPSQIWSPDYKKEDSGTSSNENSVLHGYASTDKVQIFRNLDGSGIDAYVRFYATFIGRCLHNIGISISPDDPSIYLDNESPKSVTTQLEPYDFFKNSCDAVTKMKASLSAPYINTSLECEFDLKLPTGKKK